MVEELTNLCPLCSPPWIPFQTDCPDLIFTKSATIPYEEIPPTDYRDDRLNIVFQDADMVSAADLARELELTSELTSTLSCASG